MTSHSETLRRIEGKAFDVCVIGGGASGAGCAWDAQLRGLSTVLIEAGDFASATSSSSTKLVHGGVRYLQQAVADLDAGQYQVVKRALHERRLMLDNAPYLAHPIEILVPCYSLREVLYYRVGMKIYDWIAGKGNLFPSRYRNVAESIARMPMLKPDGLSGTVAYGDGQFDDARYGLALVHSFVDQGGEAVNYARVVGFERDSQGKLAEAEIEDTISHQRLRVKTRAFVNATGPFSDSIRDLAKPGIEPRLRLSKGVHLLLPLDSENITDAILIPETDDGRVIFAIPWQGRLLVGTTDDEAALDDELIVRKAEAEYLLRHLNRYLAAPLTLQQVVSAFAGLRPLMKSGDARNTGKLVRDHEVELEPESGLISILGGKWTTHRAMAEEGINAVVQYLGTPAIPCQTAHHPLSGAEGFTPGYWRTLVSSFGLSPATGRHLAEKFGTNAPKVLAIVEQEPRYASAIVSGLPPIQAEIVYSVRHEMALSIEDVLARRLGLQWFGWAAAIESAPLVGRILAELLGWSSGQRQQAIDEYVDKVTRFMTEIGLVPDAVMV